MKKKIFLAVGIVVLVLAGLAAIKAAQIGTLIAFGKSFVPPPETVSTAVAKEEKWQETIPAVGSISAVQGVRLTAEVPGTVLEIAFESGAMVARGDLLVRLDVSTEEAQLRALEAQVEFAQTNLARFQSLRTENTVSQAELDQAQTDLKQKQANADAVRATIAKKVIRAPFAGKLGIRQINVGQYVQAGDPIVPLQALDPIHVDFDVPQQAVAALAVGREVRVTAEGVPGEIAGQVTAIDSVLDPATRNVRVQATLANADGTLRPGMFVEARLAEGTGQQVIPIPASAIAYAPYGDSVYVVAELEGPNGKRYQGVRQQFVKLGSGRGDQVAVLSGLEPGAEVVSSGVFKLRNGAAVLVDNRTQPGNSPAPEPEDS